jgi:quercetin dioxygenase-like cupin family protein
MRRGWMELGVVLLLGAAAWGQFGSQMKMSSNAAAKFAALPGLPACSTLAVQNGDPSKGPALILVKAKAGCEIPWHWHTANESLMFVGGKAKVEMKNMAPSMVGGNDYIYLPAKQPHQFTCAAACTFFLSSDAKFDIHYVDAAGKEITPEQALKPAAKPAGKAAGKSGGGK